MRNIFLSIFLFLSMVVCQISEATQSILVGARYKDHRVKVNFKDTYAPPLLIYASREGHISVVRSQLEKHAHTLEDLWTALMIASMRDHIEVVRLLLEYGADVNHPNKAGESLLDHERDFSEDVKRLLRESVE